MLQDTVLTKLSVTITIYLRPDAQDAFASDVDEALTDVITAYVERHVAEDGCEIDVKRAI